MPNCEIFDRSDFHYFYTIKFLRKGGFGVKIKNFIKYLGVHLGPQNSLCICSMQSLQNILSKRIRDWCIPWAYESELMHLLSISVKIQNLKRAFKPCWAYMSGTDAWTQHAGKELMRMLSLCIRSLRVCSACASETKWGPAPPKIKIIS